MADYNCNACEALREEVPSLVVNGFDDTMCASLKNDTGLATSSGHNDCTDLNNLNDCLIGNMENEVDLYDVCNWKDYMKMFANNVWTVLKGIICAICGLWTNIHSIWSTVKEMQCQLKYLLNGKSFKIGEAETAGSYIVAGKGVSFLTRSEGGLHESDVSLVYIGGGLGRLSGSIEFFTKNWEEPGQTKVVNLDNGTTERTSYGRHGNKYWNDDVYKGEVIGGNELIYEVRIKKSQYPELKQIIGMQGQPFGAGAYLCSVSVFDGDNILSGQTHRWAYGQHGSCANNGDPLTHTNPVTHVSEQTSGGHIVPKGWIYVQLRMSYLESLVHGASASRNSAPTAIVGMRFDSSKMDC